MSDDRSRRFRVPEMEGRTARWYARQRGSTGQMQEFRRQAVQLTASLPEAARVLEVAPGPGYFSVEVARLGFPVTGLDISHTMVEIATAYARQAGVAVDFQHGDATDMRFGTGYFDLIVCQAAFKNFLRPVQALNEMHRVLRPGGIAVIQDLNREATRADLAEEVDSMQLDTINALITRTTLGWLRRRAHPQAEFRRLAGRSAFGTCTVTADGIGLDVRLSK
ncbi:MAG TPA: class I SAM-dependent methyltransferase [Kineosporiaceae bacterium]|jgi:ubiquinone/menaquinone biosynthesis C-methylase UbiE|nr:class I SAM-dependent methyltransferase [Kineosporiaceae bacterium]